ncbi:MAG TPA: hypothetical protein VKB80_18315, partial [Kofleriaceae bacterium]|nr:hypothetical protein [Kofleriaceae bacterium]
MPHAEPHALPHAPHSGSRQHSGSIWHGSSWTHVPPWHEKPLWHGPASRGRPQSSVQGPHSGGVSIDVHVQVPFSQSNPGTHSPHDALGLHGSGPHERPPQQLVVWHTPPAHCCPDGQGPSSRCLSQSSVQGPHSGGKSID